MSEQRWLSGIEADAAYAAAHPEPPLKVYVLLYHDLWDTDEWHEDVSVEGVFATYEAAEAKAGSRLADDDIADDDDPEEDYYTIEECEVRA